MKLRSKLNQLNSLYFLPGPQLVHSVCNHCNHDDRDHEAAAGSRVVISCRDANFNRRQQCYSDSMSHNIKISD